MSTTVHLHPDGPLEGEVADFDSFVTLRLGDGENDLKIFLHEHNVREAARLLRRLADDLDPQPGHAGRVLAYTREATA